MFRSKRSMLVNAPVDDVFDYLGDLTRHGEWDGDDWLTVKRISPITRSVGSWCERRGSKQVYAYDVGETRTTGLKTIDIMVSMRNERLVFARSRKGDSHVTQQDVLTFELEPIPAGTRITVQKDVILDWMSLALLLPFWPFVKLYGLWALGGYLSRISSRLDGLSLDEGSRIEIERNRIQIPEQVSKNPGISHTNLLRSVKGMRRLKEMVIRQLVDEGHLRCEQKGRARRYFTQQ